MQNAPASSVQDETKLSKFPKFVKCYTEAEKPTAKFSTVSLKRFISAKSRKYDGRKMQEAEIIYKYEGAINLPQYNSYESMRKCKTGR